MTKARTSRKKRHGKMRNRPMYKIILRKDGEREDQLKDIDWRILIIKIDITETKREEVGRAQSPLVCSSGRFLCMW
jgi:hypothetical protein